MGSGWPTRSRLLRSKTIAMWRACGSRKWLRGNRDSSPGVRDRIGSRAGRRMGRRSPSSRRAREARRSGCCRSPAVTRGRSRVLPRAHRIRCGCRTGRGCWSRATSSGRRRRRSISGTGNIRRTRDSGRTSCGAIGTIGARGSASMFSWWTSRVGRPRI